MTRYFLAVLLFMLCGVASAQSTAEAAEQVRSAEAAFAKTMADRDFVAFATHIAEDAIFFGNGAQRGKHAVMAAWKGFYEGPKAPFSWRPETVEVLDSGTLAHSSGPVFDASGKQTAVFNSIWRKDPDGRWRVVFDKGAPVCPPGK